MNKANTTPNADEPAAGEAQQGIGELLRQTRERAGLDVAEAARALRIGKRYLEALEDGRNHDLPGTTYAIGFVRSYAEYLKLDGEEIVRRYKDEAQGQGVKADLVFPKPIPDSGVPGAAVLGLGVIVAALAYGVWYWNSNADDLTVERVEAVPEHMAAPAEQAVTPAPPETAVVAVAEPMAEKIAEVAPEAAAEETPPAVEEAVQEAVETAVAETESPATEPVVAEIVEPVVEAVTEPVVEPVADPVAEPAVESVVEPVVEPVAEPVVEPVVEPVAEPVAEPAVEPVAETPAVEAAAEPADEVAAAAPAAEEGASRITVRAKSNSWIQIRDEALDRLLFTRLLREGDEYEVPDRPGLRLMTGNAGALELLVDGQIIPAIGEVGEVRRNVELDPDKLKSGSAVTD